jgi:hypothetical protein
MTKKVKIVIAVVAVIAVVCIVYSLKSKKVAPKVVVPVVAAQPVAPAAK